MTIQVLLADDHGLVRAGFRLVLETEPDIQVVAEAADGIEAVERTRLHRPDVALMDVQMPLADGIEATRRIVATSTPTRILILTTFEREDYVLGALQAGASGFLLKNAPPEHLVAALHIVHEGDAILAPSVTRRLVERFASQRPVPRRGDLLAALTDREREVLGLVAQGLTNTEIAEHLHLGTTTVKTHVSNTLMKLGLRDRVQAVVFAYEAGVVQPGRHQGGTTEVGTP